MERFELSSIGRPEPRSVYAIVALGLAVVGIFGGVSLLTLGAALNVIKLRIEDS